MKTFFYFIAVLMAFPALLQAQAGEARIAVHADQTVGRISPYLTGACIEDVNHEIYGGLYSQLVFGESFQEPAADPEYRVPAMVKGSTPGVSGMWRAVRRGTARGRFALVTERPFVGGQCQQVDFVSGSGQWGVENQGLNRWGMNFVAGRPYEGHVWVRAKKPATLFASLESRDGRQVYAEAALAIAGDDWQRLDFTLTPHAAAGTQYPGSAGRLALTLRQPGSVTLGYALLQPGPWGRFKGLPVRRDVAEALVAQGLTVLRYGGSMINAAEYRWKKMIGPRDRRPPYRGTWYPYSTNSWGILDFLDFCRAAGFLAVPAVNMDETPQDMADFVEYVNGPANSPWGRRRVTDGHDGPYRLKYLELGNEEAVNEDYWRRFQPLAEAIWAKDPEIILVVGDFAYGEPIKAPYHFSGAPNIHTLAAHKKILDLARRHGHEVWFDVHIGTDSPRDWQGLRGVPSFIQALGAICPGARYKVVVFEFNAGHHDLGRALGNARAINELERIGDCVPVACSANCLQPDRQNDNGWDQGLLFLTPSQVWAQPPYYVTQMMSRHCLPKRVRSEVQSPDNALDVTATTDAGGKVLQLQVVNLANRPLHAEIAIDGFVPKKPTVRRIELQGRLDQVNTSADPQRIVPRETDEPLVNTRGKTYRIFPPCSFTILRME